MLPLRKSKSNTVPEFEYNRVLWRLLLAFISGQKRIKIRVIRAGVSEHDVITMVLTLSRAAFPAGSGRYEIPGPRHVEPSPPERLVGTFPQRDL